ncbi:malto-oligosyltrehalose trehalohydrolase [Terracidiphilus sp.]|jgi:maltooligosyltrehalose trehalohydrolase|uniref:malto-oligosyltrehalose trehalohydrolase n=1 Tax=Terracidiphilus sp. TaxID=1964191 RepID=UPI003C21BAB0
MHIFSVWAPFAKRVSISMNGVMQIMEGPDPHKWRRWHSDAGPGVDYGFLIDDDPKIYPDPRSAWQPNGVHGLSRLYDHDAFSWTDEKFQAPPLASSILYELHIGTFTPEGTFDAAIQHLDHLVRLGITHVELMPVASFEGDHGWGYDGVALYAVHEPYGGPDGLKRFVNAAHVKGLAVLLDVVYNHFGPAGNYTGIFGPYVTEAHHTPWGGAVNLEDAESNEVRRFFCDNALMWLRDYHIDGLRLDAVHAFVDRSAIHFLEQLATDVEVLEAALGRRLVLIAESDLNDPRVVTPREAGGLGLDAQWSDDFHHALFAVLHPNERVGYYEDFGTLAQLAKALTHTFVYDGLYSHHRKRIHGRLTGALSQHRFLGYIQTHDQVGNRAVGDRINHTAGINRAKIAAAMFLLAPFVPMLFQGEEWAASSPFQYFADHDDPELARLVSDGRKKEFSVFGWNPQSIPDPESATTFETSKLKWGEINDGEHAEMLEWYRALIHLRRSTPCLNDGSAGNTRATYDEAAKWICIQRGTITVICNLGQKEQLLTVSQPASMVLASRGEIKIAGHAVNLLPDTIVVLKEHSVRNA